MTIQLDNAQLDFTDEVGELAGFRMKDCYVCGKCTAGCPMDYLFDISIHRIMHLTQQGHKDLVLSAKSIWLCVSCETCSTRCPKECKPATVMDVLREIAIKENKLPEEERQLLEFHKSFLGSVKRFGRVLEIDMIRDYKFRTFTFFNDIEFGPAMMLKGKLKILPHIVKDRKTIKKIFKKYGNLR